MLSKETVCAWTSFLSVWDNSHMWDEGRHFHRSQMHGVRVQVANSQGLSLFILIFFFLPPFPSTNRISEETKQEKQSKKTLPINELTSPGRWVLSSPWTLFISIKCYLFVWLQMFPREAQMPLIEFTHCYLRLKCIWWINWKLTKL